MTPSPRKIYRPGLLFTILTLAVVLGGCASLPPPAERIDRAQRALDSAREVRAHQLSEEEFRRAERQLQAAREAEQGRDRVRALELAELAEVNADLSRARARARAWQEEVDAKTAENAALRQSLETGGRR
jgi:hypothetical protein